MITEDATVLSSADLDVFGRVVILAPHQDDETLGCGGLIQRLVGLHSDVSVIYTTDGCMSHPKSATHSAIQRSTVRKREALAALELLGVPRKRTYFLEGTDSALPNAGEFGYSTFLDRLHGCVKTLGTELIIAPCQFDPHRDHRASWSMASDIARRMEIPLWEYPIWLYQLGSNEDWSGQRQKTCAYLSLSEAEMQTKAVALQCHRSQLEDIFHDNKGFFLAPQVIAHFENGKEFFFR